LPAQSGRDSTGGSRPIFRLSPLLVRWRGQRQHLRRGADERPISHGCDRVGNGRDEHVGGDRVAGHVLLSRQIPIESTGAQDLVNSGENFGEVSHPGFPDQLNRGKYRFHTRCQVKQGTQDAGVGLLPLRP
jgi:hypothetical protein